MSDKDGKSTLGLGGSGRSGRSGVEDGRIEELRRRLRARGP